MDFKSYRTSIILALVSGLLLSTFWFFPDFAFIIFLSLLLQLVLRPVMNLILRFMRWRFSNGIAAGITMILFIALLILFLTLLSRSFLPTFTRFISDLPNLTLNLQDIQIFNDSHFLATEIDALLIEMRSFSAQILRSSLSIALSIFSKFIDFVIIIFVTFYLLKDGHLIQSYLAGLFPHASYTRIMTLFDRILDGLRAYIFSQLIMCLITAVVVFIYFSMQGLPYASVFAFLSGLAEFIPVLGPTIASAFGTILTIPTAPSLVWQTLAFYIILTQVNHNIIYPAIIGKAVNLHPIAIILGVILGDELLGGAGMFLAVPFIVILGIIIDDIYKDRMIVNHAKNLAKTVLPSSTETKK
ncbi:hypothetical protein TAMA11512_14200 [Selenomonas sp. TAMA-11512]|uniref:AI-2E family transporter n=1 Tax=Selenomonas sp. TAMA-11512 TaxID=3095337 RepID=UPI003093B7C0|nr:hypothetical protein TAMA11512_14200 [Selenomonas sp. TAMA-11512]